VAEKKIVLVVGAASGIGRAVVKLFRSEKWTVLEADKVFNVLYKYENRVGLLAQHFIDVTDQECVKSYIENVYCGKNWPNVVVNTVGVGVIGRLESISSENISAVFNTNVLGTINLLKSVIPAFRANKTGRFIQISSLAGKTAYPLSSVYNASKYAIEGLFESLRFELINDGISLHLVRPGRTDSNFGQSIKEHDGNSNDQRELIDKVRRHFESSVKKSTSCEFVAKEIFRLATMESPPFSLVCDKLTDFILKQRKKMTEDEWFDSVSKQFNL
jgi:NADP-dependent 3-hydroxy acid dehydrogenase YdfG